MQNTKQQCELVLNHFTITDGKIGDVLEKIWENDFCDEDGELSNERIEEIQTDLIDKWIDCGITNSIQKIADESGWEVEWEIIPSITGEESQKTKIIYLKSPKANALLEFLYNLIPTK